MRELPGGMSPRDRIDDLREEARYRRERLELYRAKSYGPRETSPARLRRLETESEAAQARQRTAEREASGSHD
ncbi:MAG: hypothetical protein QOE65_396 [Solirubrobacteraceae bacterium]|nr:hypothetical protein [Solirubrobacteraceae bacterium]